jgi:hypothetical protein
MFGFPAISQAIFIALSGPSSVQSVKSDGESHDFAISYPYDFSTEENPFVFTTVLANGDPLAGGSAGEIPAVAKFHFLDSGQAANSGRSGNNGPAWVEELKMKQVGTLYGLAYSRQAKKLFASALIKRHAGLGPLGSGGIYIIDPDPTKNSNVKFLNLDAIGIATSDTQNPYTNAVSGPNSVVYSPVVGSNSDRGLPADKGQPSHDSAAYGQVGQLGLGDIDISEDGRYLFVVNLYDRKLYRIDLTDPQNPVAPTAANKAAKVKSFDIPNSCTYSAKAGEYRPFGLKIRRGEAYVGIVCSGQNAAGATVASSTADMKGSIYSFNLDSNSWSNSALIEWSFDYRDNDGSGKPWHPWSNNFHSEWEYGIPLIGDIEFDNGGNMLIGLIDLHAYQLGYKNYGITDTNLHSIASVGDLIRASISTAGAQCSYSMKLSPEFYDDNYKHTGLL